MLLLALPGMVTVSFAPCPLPLALERLSAAVGERLECAPALRDEVLVLRLKDADGARVLREVADCLGARWEARGEGRKILLRDPQAARRREQEELQASLDTVRGSLAYLARRLKEQPPTFGAAEAAAFRLKTDQEKRAKEAAEAAKDYDRMFLASGAAELSPAWRAAARIMPRIGEKELLASPVNSRVVWTEKPTAVQRRFPVGATSILRDYRRELAALNPTAEPARFRLIAKRWEHGGAFNVEFQALDGGGKVVDTAFLRMANDMDRLKTPGAGQKPAPPLPGEKPLPYRDEEREYATVMSDLEGEGPAKAALLRKWRPILADPVAHEPTQWLPAGRLLAAAEAMGKNLVGTPGETTGSLYERLPESETPSQFVAKSYGVVERDGWLILTDPERIARISRSKAKALIGDAVRQGGLALDRVAAWVGASPDRFPFTNWVGDHLSTLLTSGGPYSASAVLHDEYNLRLWDALGGPARRALREGRTIDLNGLPPLGKEWVARLAYWFGGVEGGEPTEILPDGIAGGTVGMKVEETALILPSSSKEGDARTTMAMSAEMLGKYLAKGDPYREIKVDVFRRFDRYRLGVYREYTLTFLLGPQRIPMSVGLAESFLDPTAPALTALPRKVQDEVDAARAKAEAKPDAPGRKAAGTP